MTFNEGTKSLKMLSVNIIALKGVQDLKFYRKSEDIRVLTLEYTNVKTLSGLLQQCPNLVYLNASHNQLTNGNVKLNLKNNCLEEVYLTHNCLANVADLVPHCRRLRILDISYNKISRVEKIASLIMLVKL